MKYNEFSFTDEDLRIATRITRQRMITSLPTSEDYPYEASDGLRAKINQIIIKDRRRNTIRTIRNQVAMIALCILLGIGAWLSVDTEARAAFVQWVREVYEDSVIYHYFGKRESEEIPKYEITDLPQGYTETMRFEESFMHTVFYESEDDVIILTYQIIDASTQKVFSGTEMTHENVELINYNADYYSPKDSTKTNELVWIDEESMLTFCISSYLDQDTIIDLANSVLEVEK